MVIDSSALIAILLNEAEAERYENAIDADPVRIMSAASVLETTIVIASRLGEDAVRDIDLLIHRLPIDVRDFDNDQMEWARTSYLTYGRGRHQAALNFGDCFSYALAKVTGQPLLYEGDDFTKTDILKAEWGPLDHVDPARN